MTPEGEEVHTVVDGQQRIQAVLGYAEGDFAIEEQGSRWEGMTFDDLPPGDRTRFFEYAFLTRVLPDMSEEQLRSIFQRINRGTVALNAQELRHATYWGEFIRLMEELADLPFWDEAGIFSANDRRRMLDAEFVSELTVALLNGIQNKKTRLEDFYQLYEREFEDSSTVRTVFFNVIGEISQLLPTIRSTRFKKKSDFYTLFLVLAEFRSRLPFAAEARERLSRFLTEFASAVDEYSVVSLEAQNPAVEQYAINVARAASDLSSRRRRHEALASESEALVGAPGEPFLKVEGSNAHLSASPVG